VSSRRRQTALALDGPPPIGLGLRRFALRSVGPPAARFHPLDLDMVTTDGKVAHRVLCVLTNTGGKSTLLKLLSSVVNPGTAGLIGKGEVADMVLATDTSHVVLEWQQADGTRYVTAWVGEWARFDKPQSGSKGLKQHWYTFRVVTGLGVDDLPFEHEGRRVRSDEYRRQLRARFSDHPSALGLIADTQTAWRQALSERTLIDERLFSYQATMNAAESGAAALVTRLKTPEAVVGFFVEAFDDDARTTEMFKEVTAYITQAASRANMETHAVLCGELAEAVERFQVQDGEYSTAVDMELYDIERRREMAGAVRARSVVEEARAAEAGQAHEAAVRVLAATRQAIDLDEDRRAQYLFVEAEMRRAVAERAALAADHHEQETDLQNRAWQKVDDAADYDAALATDKQAQATFDEAERELAPLRARAEAAASQLVAGLHAQASAATTAAQAAQGRTDESRRAQAQANKRRDEARTAAAAAREVLRAGDARASLSTQLVTDSRRAGDIGAKETAAEAEVRWGAIHRAAGKQRERGRADKDAATEAKRGAGQDRSAALLARQKALAAAKTAADLLDHAAASAAHLLDSPDLVAAIGGAPPETAPHRVVPASVATEAAGQIEEQARSVEEAALDTGALLRSVSAELERLDGSDLLDAGADVASAVAVLRDATIGAVTGWSWLADVVPADDRVAFITSRPDIANGVVVNDPSRLDEARRALEKAGLLPRLAVAVTTTSTAGSTADNLPDADRGDEAGDRFVVEPHPGLYDKGKAEEEIARLRDHQVILRDRHAEQTARARTLREAVGLARRHAEDWPDSRLDVVEAGKAVAERDAELAEAREAAAADAVAAAVAAEKAAQVAEHSAAEEEKLAAAADRRLVPVVQVEKEATTYAATRPGLVEQIARHERDTRLATDAVEAAEGQAEMAAEQRRKSEQVAQVARDRAVQIGVIPAPDVPAEPIHVLEAAHGTLAEQLVNEAAGRDHMGTLDRARAEVRRAGERLSGVAEDVLELARQYASSVMAGTREAVRAAEAAAGQAWTAAVNHKVQCRHEADKWAEVMETRRPSDRPVHAVLVGDEIPADADDAVRRASELDGRLFTARALRDSQQAEVNALEEATRAATSAAQEFSRLVLSQDDPVLAAEPYLGDLNAAHRVLDELRTAVGDATKQAAEARLARQAAAGEVNKGANDRRWGDIPNSLQERCASASPEMLSEHGEQYRNGLRSREASLVADIADLDKHRSVVIDSLGQSCDQIQRSLRRVKAASTIPSKVFGVGGQQAISIDFKPLPTEAANAGLTMVIDRWAAEGSSLGADTKTRQVRLMQALSATIEKRPQAGCWTVRMLKPRIDGDVTFCPPERITREYSGGQELTLAVLLYCTLAAVRADDRTGRDRPPGLLLLDNPFGAASSERLIQMQQELAAAADVQLFCLTALGEPSILNGFNGPGTFRQTLRNDRDQRNGHQHVRALGADETTQRRVTAHLAGPALEDGEESRVGGIGYQTRRPFPAEAPGTGQESDSSMDGEAEE